MEKLTINGHVACNFGSNNYSHGMEAIVFNPSMTTIEQVKNLPNVFLHPTVEPNSLEIFALLGTQEQFDGFFKDAKETYCSQQAVKELGGIPSYNNEGAWKKIHEREDELWAEFKPWHE